MNNAKRKVATSDFKKNFYKDCNNIIFGKLMQAVRGRLSIRPIQITDTAKIEKAINHQNFKRLIPISKKLVLAEIGKSTVTLDQPIYCGLTVLALAKEQMARFWYGDIVPKYEDSAKLLYTDTDSMYIKISNEDPNWSVYDDMTGPLAHKFDLAEMPADMIPEETRKKYPDLNKKKAGCFGDEMLSGGILKTCSMFLALRAKVKTYETYTRPGTYMADGKEKIIPENTYDNKFTLKGIRKCVVKNELTLDKW